LQKIETIVIKDILYLKLEDGSEREIAASELVAVQPWFGLTPVQVGNKMAIAGPGHEYFIVKTKNEELKIPRHPDFSENDKEILDFIFSNCEIHKKS
jgi:hypothetical protein